MISAFPMYEVSNIEQCAFSLMQSNTDTWYSTILQEFYHSIPSCKNHYAEWIPPQKLTRSKESLASLSDTAKEGKLFLAQVCSLPALVYSDSFQVLASPVYCVDGCDSYLTRSVLIVRADSTIETIESLLCMRLYEGDLTIAISSRTSTSGCLLLAATFGRDFMSRAVGRIKYTGSHLGSIHCVSEGRADLAAVDCVTFATIRRYFPGNFIIIHSNYFYCRKYVNVISDVLRAVKIIGYTVSVPSAPYVTSANAPSDIVSCLQTSLSQSAGLYSGQLLMSEVFPSSFYCKEDLAAHYKEFMYALQKQASMSLSDMAAAVSTLVGPPLTASLQAIEIRTLVQSSPTRLDVSKGNVSSQPSVIAPEFARQYLQPLLPVDLAFMETLLACLRSELTCQLSSSSRIDRSQPWSTWRAISGERSVRMIFPSGLDTAAALLSPDTTSESTDPLQMVCFIGRRRAIQLCPATDLDAVQSCWAADAELVERLPASSSLAMYATAEMEHGGDWGNILLMRRHQTAPITELLQQLNTTRTECPHSHGMNTSSSSSSSSSSRISHETAMATISPRYYSTVRLHRVLYYANVPNQPLRIQRTNFIQYQPTEDLEFGIIHRNIVQWEKTPNDASSEDDFFGHNDSLFWESFEEWNSQNIIAADNLLSSRSALCDCHQVLPSLEDIFDLLSEKATETLVSTSTERAAHLLMQSVNVALLCSRIAGKPLIPHLMLLHRELPSSLSWLPFDCDGRVYDLHVCVRDGDEDVPFGRAKKGQAFLSNKVFPGEHWLRIPFHDSSLLPPMDIASSASRIEMEGKDSTCDFQLQWLRFVSWRAQRSLHHWLARLNGRDLEEAASVMAIAVADCRERLLKLCKAPPICKCSYGNWERLKSEMKFCFHDVVLLLEEPRMRNLNCMLEEHNPLQIIERITILLT